MKLNNNQKILALGFILLVLAGLIVVLLKGMNVDFMLMQHKYINISVGTAITENDVKDICKNVFDSKKCVIKKVGVFGDTIQINAMSITDEEKSNIITQINEKYGTELVADGVEINSMPRIRIMDLVRPYIIPTLISTVAIYVYIIIRFRKQNFLMKILNITSLVVITLAVITSLIAIVRLPVSQITISSLFLIVIGEVVWFVSNKCNK